MQHPWFFPLGELTTAHAQLVGGKALNLGRLIRANFPCPPGIVVSTAAYQDFVERHELIPVIATVLGECDAVNPKSLDWAATAISAAFRKHDLPRQISQALITSFHDLLETPVAIRSSGSSEDLPLFSFAGQHDTILDVTGLSDILLAIRQCWASLWSARAIQYRARAGIDHRACLMAVLIQPMVRPVSAGVVFTAEPYRSSYDHIIINAARGLGEHVVDGTVAPATYIVNRRTLVPTDWLHQTSRLKTTGDTRNVGPGLRPDNIKAIAELCLRIEKFFGKPQDIEWALVGKAVYVLQSRDITTTQVSPKAQLHIGARAFLSFFFDYFPRPMYPFDAAVMRSIVDHTLGLAADFALRPADFSSVLHEDADGSYNVRPVMPQLTAATICCFFPSIVRALASLRKSPETWITDYWPHLQQRLRELDTIDLQQLSTHEILEYCDRAIAIRDEIFLVRRPYFWGGWLALALFPLLLRCIVRSEASKFQHALLSNLDHPTQRMNEQISAIAEDARAKSVQFRDLYRKDRQGRLIAAVLTHPTSPAIDDRLARFMSEFGSRSNDLISLPSSPTWESEPTSLIALLKGLMIAGVRIQTDPYSEKEMGTCLAQRLRASPWRFLGLPQLLISLLPKVRAMVRERDWTIHGYACASRHIRFAMLELGERLIGQGYLRGRDEIKFLTLVEIEGLISKTIPVSQVRALVMRRQFGRPRTTWGWRRPAHRSKIDPRSDVILSGLAASPGVHQGVARVIYGSDEFYRIGRGDILVCQATTPAWTPLFGIAGAVVADLGGTLSHAAIVAREYGIPAVLNTSDATAAVRDGELYVVDGDRGIVRRVPQT